MAMIASELLASARMYGMAPERLWRTLFAWVAEASGVKLVYRPYPPPLPLEALWRRDDLGAAFMCGLPFARSRPRPHLVAAPCPRLAGGEGKARYGSALIVATEAPYRNLDEALGCRLALTARGSWSGHEAVRHFLGGRYGRSPRGLFEIQAPTVTPRGALEAVVEGRADLGALDAYALALFRRHEPALAARVRVLAETDWAPAPPLVASPAVSPETVAALRRALLRVREVTELREILDGLCLDGFAAVEKADYEILLARCRESDALDPSPLL